MLGGFGVCMWTKACEHTFCGFFCRLYWLTTLINANEVFYLYCSTFFVVQSMFCAVNVCVLCCPCAHIKKTSFGHRNKPKPTITCSDHVLCRPCFVQSIVCVLCCPCAHLKNTCLCRETNLTKTHHNMIYINTLNFKA